MDQPPSPPTILGVAHRLIKLGSWENAKWQLLWVGNIWFYLVLFVLVLMDFSSDTATLPLWISLIHSPHLLVRVTSERFLPAGGTFRAILASESHWLQPVLVLSIHWWPTPINVGGLLAYLVGYFRYFSIIKEISKTKPNQCSIKGLQLD